MPFNGYSKKPSHFSRILRRAWEYGEHILILTPLVPVGGVGRGLRNSNEGLMTEMHVWVYNVNCSFYPILKWCIRLGRILFVYHRSPRAHVARLSGRLRLIRSVLRA